MNRREQWCSSDQHRTVRNATTDDKDKWQNKREKNKDTEEMIKK
jgi:hypothetical protein